MRKMYKDQGVNLIEMLIAISIVAILAAISIPSFIDLLQTNKLRLAANNFYKTTLYARSEAIKQNVPIYFIFQVGNPWCYGVKANASCDCRVAGSCNLRSVTSTDFSGVTLSATGVGDGNFIFDDVRASADDSGTVTFSLGNKTINVNFTRMGTPQICSNQVNGYKAC